MQDYTPKQIVEQLDRYIIGQAQAKRSVAVAIRNRWRRQQLDRDLAREVSPKNIVMSGPTGVGKTEVARRLAKLTGAPFIKVEASKFTEVGYHGRDVESMIRDLLDQAMGLVRAEMAAEVEEKAKDAVNDRLVDLMFPGSDDEGDDDEDEDDDDRGAPRPRPESRGGLIATEESQERRQRTRRRLKEQIVSGRLDQREVDLDITRKPQASVMFANMGMDQMDPEMSNMLEKIMPEQNKRMRTTVAEARRILTEEETDRLLDQDKVTQQAIARTQDSGIVFLDEIDKVATPGGSGGGASGGGGKGGPDVSRQGVQRDLLPIVEGAAVTTRHGVVHTDHILFIAAGAFHSAQVSDLMPELQGRFPIRVELQALTKDDFVRILTEPQNALTRQQEALLGVEGMSVEFEDGAIDAIAELAAKANESIENIGARRLMTIVEKVFEQVNFDAPERVGGGEDTFAVTEAFVRQQVSGIVGDTDLSRFVL